MKQYKKKHTQTKYKMSKLTDINYKQTQHCKKRQRETSLEKKTCQNAKKKLKKLSNGNGARQKALLY